MSQASRYRVKNWEQFQHYKDRNPPWIKLHFAVLSSEDWVMLDDASRVLMVACMLVASRNDGFVPSNPAFLKRVAYLKRAPNFKPLIECGFLEIPQADASASLADASALQADARPEERQSREESLSETSSDAPEKPSRKKRTYPPDFETVWTAYPTDANMSKADAFDAWKKLDAADKDALAASIPAFVAYCRAHPDYRPKHMVGYIKSRRFDGHAQAQPTAAVDETTWLSRMKFARERHTWSTSEWGPRPGESGCLVPKQMLEPGDGQDWREWEKAA